MQPRCRPYKIDRSRPHFGALNACHFIIVLSDSNANIRIATVTCDSLTILLYAACVDCYVDKDGLARAAGIYRHCNVFENHV